MFLSNAEPWTLLPSFLVSRPNVSLACDTSSIICPSNSLNESLTLSKICPRQGTYMPSFATAFQRTSGIRARMKTTSTASMIARLRWTFRPWGGILFSSVQVERFPNPADAITSRVTRVKSWQRSTFVGNPSESLSEAALSSSMNHSLTIRIVSSQTNALFVSLNADFTMARCLFHSAPSRVTMLGPNMLIVSY